MNLIAVYPVGLFNTPRFGQEHEKNLQYKKLFQTKMHQLVNDLYHNTNMSRKTKIST